ncbi:fungal-specific transcription factor domain-containing protein [Paraphoma chrysanthemicola]|nr:fungal-specific transcription factor domain-containing protein [Paraphoma chrysanthemicola]
MDDQGVDKRTSSRIRQACLNCRRKKVKCNGEKPSCSFCSRLQQNCVYRSRRWTIAPGNKPSSNSPPDMDMINENPASIKTPPETHVNILESGLESVSTGNGAPSADWISSSNPSDVSLKASRGTKTSTQPAFSIRIEPQLPPPQVLSSTMDKFFSCFHNQPYCFFHQETFQEQLRNSELPKYLIYAVLGIAIRFSDDPFYVNKDHTAAQYASLAWKDVISRIFDSEEALDYRLVQAATLLSIYDFTAGKHRTAWIKIGVSVNVAQALHLMTEPPSTLPFSAQEERRRTLWSIYLLDKLATCGRHRPSLFLDRTLRLRLPCSEDSFETSTPEQMVALEEFPNIIDTHVEHMETLAPTIAMTSLLSQIANYAFGENITSDRKEPWDHTSEYQTIRSRLARFETFFDCYGDVQEKILSRHLSPYEPNIKITESTIFTYTLYQLCYCLLQHPFLIRRRLEKSGFKPPANFLARTFSSCSHHARELTRTLENARHAQYKVSATFLSYSSLVAGSIHCLFQHSLDCLTRVQSVEALQSSIMHINEKGKYWKTSSRMVEALTQYSVESVRHSGLLDPSLQCVPLEPADIEQLYALCDYGTMSTFYNVDSTHTYETNMGSGIVALGQDQGSEIRLEDYSGHIDGIIPQIFGLADTDTMIQNLSFVLEDYNEGKNSSTSSSWRF